MRSALGSGEAAKTCLKSWWTTTRRRPRTGRGRRLLAGKKRRVGKVAEADHQVVHISISWSRRFLYINNPQVQARWGRQALIFCRYLREGKVRRKTRHSLRLPVFFSQWNHVSRIWRGAEIDCMRKCTHKNVHLYTYKYVWWNCVTGIPEFILIKCLVKLTKYYSIPAC